MPEPTGRAMATRAEIVSKFVEAQTKLHMSMEEAEALSVHLADRIRSRFLSDSTDGRLIVAGIANGGLMTARIVAESLSIPMEIICIRRRGSRIKRALGRFRPLVHSAASALQNPVIGPLLGRLIDRAKGLETVEKDGETKVPSRGGTDFSNKHVILVDDCIETGQSVLMAKDLLIKAGADTVSTGVLTLKNLENDPSKVDQYSPIVFINNRIQHYPWSQNNECYDDWLAWLRSRGIELWN